MVSERRKSRLLPTIQVELIKQFVAGATARTSAEFVGVNRHTATLYFHKLREIIAKPMAAEAPFLAGEIEVDESYFGGVRKGKRGRGAAGKVPVFGLLKRGGRVYTIIIDDAKSQTLLGIIRDRIQHSVGPEVIPIDDLAPLTSSISKFILAQRDDQNMKRTNFRKNLLLGY